MLRLTLLCASLVTVSLALAASDPVPKGAAKTQAQWPVFRGNAQQTGVAQGKLPKKLTQLWAFKTDDAIEGAPAIADGMVFTGSMDEHLYAVDLKSGQQKWKFKGGPFKASPSFRDGLVYASDLDGKLYCLNAKNADKKWVFNSDAEAGGINFHGTSVLFGSHDENLYCVNKDGKESWKVKIDGPIYGSVAVAEGKTFLAGCDSQLHVIDVATGKTDRSVDLEGQTGATAAVSGSQLFVGTMRNEVRAIDWKKGELLWTYRGKRGAAAFFSSPAVTDRFVVIGCRDNNLHCIDRKSGTAVWTFPTPGKVDSSPVVIGDHVVIGSLDGESKVSANKDNKGAEKVEYYVYVLELASGKVAQRLEVDGPVSGSAAFASGRLLIGTQKGTLYCFGEK